MAFGDVGGPVTAMVITCKTPDTGNVMIKKGDAVRLTGNYEVNAVAGAGAPLFGQALANMEQKGAALPVKVRGVCDFTYTGTVPLVDGVSGVTLSEEAGKVMRPSEGTGHGIVLRVDSTRQRVTVLL